MSKRIFIALAAGFVALSAAAHATDAQTPQDVRQNAIQQAQYQTDPARRTFWDHNGSMVYLVASGSQRSFYYEMPRPGLLEAGARPGTLLFEGQAVDDAYFGTAYIFNRGCGAFGYQVSGPILENYRRVQMRGQAPRVGADCQVFGYVDDVLEFQLIDR